MTNETMLERLLGIAPADPARYYPDEPTPRLPYVVRAYRSETEDVSTYETLGDVLHAAYATRETAEAEVAELDATWEADWGPKPTYRVDPTL